MCSESVYQHTNSAKGVCEYMMLVLLAELLMGSRSDAICGAAEHKHDLFFSDRLGIILAMSTGPHLRKA
jgi:hypothetical protein